MNNSTTVGRCESASAGKMLPFSWARFVVLKMMANLQNGQIVLQEQQQKWLFGQEGSLRVHLTVNDKSFYRKVLLRGSIGCGEAYVDGSWQVDDLPALMRIMVRNMHLVDKMEQGLAWLLRAAALLRHARNSNSRRRSKRNIHAHYDLGNELYAAFLDSAMMYSAAIYPKADSSLEEASEYKLELICKKLDLQPADRVIEIGGGWGGFALYAARHYGCHVTTTTISDAQYLEAKKRIDQAGLHERIKLLSSDYRDLTGQYDKLVSIEMIEAVGHQHMPLFFSQCGKLLKPGGRMLLQAITIADQKYEQYSRSVDFIQRYIFPGGCLPSNARMVQLIAEKTDMVVRHLEDFGLDYARTLQDWRSRFNASFGGLRGTRYGETFKRLWNYYLCYCEGGFLERSISVVQLVASRPPKWP